MLICFKVVFFLFSQYMSFGTCPLSKLITGRIIFVQFPFNVTWKFKTLLNLSNNFSLT